VSFKYNTFSVRLIENCDTLQQRAPLRMSLANPIGTQNLTLSDQDVRAIDALRESYARLCAELGKVIVGQREVIEQVAICLFARRHALLMGVPGLAKTLLVSKIAETMSLGFNRIQFTPDLMPMDITGTDILQENSEGRREFQFIRGPIFENIILADEINRAPPKTQAALLEAMQEQRVTVLGKSSELESPFMVLATQNPVEQEGTYPLPEAQLDRFMFLVELDYPSELEEIQIARTTTGDDLVRLSPVLSGEEIMHHQKLVRRIPVPDHIYEYAARLVRKTRPQGTTAPDWLKPFVSWGAGPRAVQNIILGAKSRAALQGSYMVRLEDVQYVAKPVLVHRLITTFAAQAEGISAKQIVSRLVDEMQ
jgi:MoxR-like ATPase